MASPELKQPLSLSKWTKFWLTELLTICYFMVVGLVSVLNTATWLTEPPYEQVYHQPGLYAVVKGFNTFFGMIVLIVVVFIAFVIGDRILLIPDLRIRAHYNFYLFVISATATVIIPFLYMLCRHLHLFTLSPVWNHFYLLCLSTFLALNACILFLLSIFLLLTALMCTLRSYSVFKYLVKLRRLHIPPPPPLTKKSAMKKMSRQKSSKTPVSFRPIVPGQPLPTVIGKVPRKYRLKYYQQKQQQLLQQQQQHYQLLTPAGTPSSIHRMRMMMMMMRQHSPSLNTSYPLYYHHQARFGSRTPSIPSTSWQSYYSRESRPSSTASSPRAIRMLGYHQPFHYRYLHQRPSLPSSTSREQEQQGNISSTSGLNK